MNLKEASALRAISAGIISIIALVGGWWMNPFITVDQVTSPSLRAIASLSTFCAWALIAVGAIALIAAIVFAYTAWTLPEAEDESDGDRDENSNGEHPGPTRFSSN
jgi:hypothetical protein